MQQLLLSCEVTLKYNFKIQLKSISPSQRSVIEAYKNILLHHGSLKLRNPEI